MDDSLISQIRAFNRFYTRQIGVLDEHIVESAFSLAEARVLYEIGKRGSATATELAAALSLDRAYLSRILAGFATRELVVQSPVPGDRRQSAITLTPAGEAIVAGLNSGSDAAVEAMLGTLGAVDRRRVVAAMADIRTLLGDKPPTQPVVLRPQRLGELGWLIHRQAVLYNEQFGWNAEFEALIARIYSEYEQAAESPPKALWVADRGTGVLGSVFVTPHPSMPGVAQLRMLYVEPAARGLGLGTQLVAQAVDFGRRHSYRRMRLWTQSTLVSARRIYAAAGFTLTESAPHHSFGHDLVGEYWEMGLAG